MVQYLTKMQSNILVKLKLVKIQASGLNLRLEDQYHMLKIELIALRWLLNIKV